MGPASESSRADRRRQILDAAERLIHHYGFDKTTVADIAKAVGIGVGSVYLEFASKEEIAGALSHACHQKILLAMREAARAEASFARRLRRIFDVRTKCLAELAATGHHAMELVVHRTCTGISNERQRFEREQEAILETLLREGHAARELHVDEPSLAARVLLQAYAAYTPPQLHERDADETQRLLAATHELVTGGLLRRT